VSRLDGVLAQKITALRAHLDDVRAKVVLCVDFPEEETECLDRNELNDCLDLLERELAMILAGSKRARILHDGARVVLVGQVNAGKSSLLNQILGRNRALVSSQPGTTRDYLEEFCDVNGVPIRFMDTAGLRVASIASDEIEELGIARSHACVAEADVVCVLLDGSFWTEQMLRSEYCPEPEYAKLLEDIGQRPHILVWNKLDLSVPAFFPPQWAIESPCVQLSASKGIGVEDLLVAIEKLLLAEDGSTCVEQLSCNLRQADLLRQALEELKNIQITMAEGGTFDLLAVQLEYLATKLGEIIGVSTAEDVLNDIFRRFCLGK
ncbi:MAG: 50S ribosome-binding GTPase, partial [Desulfovibrio sp.]|nr:50S ribosome-binding GTPase [Desulfovibrio sp.]